MTEVVIKDLETGLRDLFRKAYLTNCEIESEELTESDHNTLDDLDSLEILENFKDLVESLLGTKRDFKRTDKSELASRCEQFETMLQKLESEVRTHIRVGDMQIEQQLKLHADALQAKLDEIEKTGRLDSRGTKEGSQSTETDEVLRRQSASTLELLSQDKEEVPTQSHRRVFSLERDGPEFKGDTKAQKLYELAEAKHRALLRLEKECISLRVTYDKRLVDLERFKQDYERVLRELQLYRIKKTQEVLARKKSEEKNLERVRVSRQSPERAALTDRQVRKSAELERKSEVHSKYTENSYNSRSKLDSTPQPHNVEVVRRKTHTRTVSEKVKRPVTSVKSRQKV